MPKRAFYPATLIVFGLILMADMGGFLPAMFSQFWPLLMVIVGLGGLLTADKEAWMTTPERRSAARSSKPAKKASRR